MTRKELRTKIIKIISRSDCNPLEILEIIREDDPILSSGYLDIDDIECEIMLMLNQGFLELDVVRGKEIRMIDQEIKQRKTAMTDQEIKQWILEFVSKYSKSWEGVIRVTMVHHPDLRKKRVCRILVELLEETQLVLTRHYPDHDVFG